MIVLLVLAKIKKATKRLVIASLKIKYCRHLIDRMLSLWDNLRYLTEVKKSCEFHSQNGRKH